VALEGRTALVTGAARGIGRVSARVLAEAGARVAVADRDPGVEETAERLRERGAESAAAIFDVASAAEVAAAVADLGEAFGPIDILVSNAAIVDHIAPVARMQAERWEQELAVNLGGAFHLVRAVLPGMAERGWGRIVVISSIAARGGLRLQAGYAASKSGLIGLAQTVALEHARDGITCNAILPGLIESENVARMPAEIREAMVARTPAGRLGSMDEVAHLVAFLASDDAGYINGAEIRIDGGASLNTTTLGSRRELRRSGG
jgi:NAD(P)-dependent dehydrogenase (short-subunit alcohol dehydrogenase family)